MPRFYGTGIGVVTVGEGVDEGRDVGVEVGVGGVVGVGSAVGKKVGNGTGVGNIVGVGVTVGVGTSVMINVGTAVCVAVAVRPGVGAGGEGGMTAAVGNASTKPGLTTSTTPSNTQPTWFPGRFTANQRPLGVLTTAVGLSSVPWFKLMSTG
jgi:hypothetical protein